MLHMPSVRDRSRRTSLGQVSGGVAIHDAVVKGKIHLAKFILDAVESNTVVNSRDAHGKTPLIRAVRIDEEGVRHKVVDLLLKYHADVNLADNVGRTPLSYACELHRNDVITKLVKNNVDPNLKDNLGNTALMYCALTNNANGIRMLSKSFRRLGLDVDMMNAEGMTPLMVAAKSGFAECAQLFAHEAKASLLTRDNVHNMNAIEWAREGGCSTPDVEALQPRSRSHSRPTVNLANKDQNEREHCHQERMLPKRGSIPLNYSEVSRDFVASPLRNQSNESRESKAKYTGSQQDVSRLPADMSRFHQLSVDEQMRKFHGVSCMSSSEEFICQNNQSSSKLVKTRNPQEFRLLEPNENGSSDVQAKPSSDDIPDVTVKTHEQTSLQNDFILRPATATSVLNNLAHQPTGYQRRRPLSANMTNRHDNRQTKSFDNSVTLSSYRSPSSIDNLAVTQYPIIPHPPTTAKEFTNLIRASHLSKSSEVLSQRRSSLDHEHRGIGSNVACVDLHNAVGSKQRPRQHSLLPGDLSDLFETADSKSNTEKRVHLPALSRGCVSREV